MKLSTLNLFSLNTLTAGLALSLSLSACGTSEGGDDLGSTLDQIAAQAEQAALREHGVDQADQDAAAADEAAGAELGDEADEAPPPGERIATFCADRAAEVLANCEERVAGGEALPEGVDSCETVSANAEERCVRRAVRHVRHRMEAHRGECRQEAQAAAQACRDGGGDRATCREEAVSAGQACIEANPGRPEGGEGRPDRPQPPMDGEGGDRPQPPMDGEGGDRPQPPMDGEGGDRPQPPVDGEGRPLPPLSEACHQAARDAGEACIADGGEPQDCRQVGMDAGRTCAEAEAE